MLAPGGGQVGDKKGAWRASLVYLVAEIGKVNSERTLRGEGMPGRKPSGKTYGGGLSIERNQSEDKDNDSSRPPTDSGLTSFNGV